MNIDNITTTGKIAIVVSLTSVLGAPLFYAIETGNDRLIGFILAVMMPIIFLGLFRTNLRRYRHASDSRRKLAKLQSDLPLLLTGFSLAFTLLSQGFISEWNDGWKVIERMNPALSTLSGYVNSKQCIIPRRTATPCLAAKESFKEIHEQILNPNSEQMRITLRKLRLNAFMMTSDEPVEIRDSLREMISASISDMENQLPPQLQWLKVLDFPLAMLSVVIFLISGSMRLALSWVEWDIARCREGYPA